MNTSINKTSDLNEVMSIKKEQTAQKVTAPSPWDLPREVVIRSRAAQQKFFDEYFLPNFQYFKKE